MPWQSYAFLENFRIQINFFPKYILTLSFVFFVYIIVLYATSSALQLVIQSTTAEELKYFTFKSSKTHLPPSID